MMVTGGTIVKCSVTCSGKNNFSQPHTNWQQSSRKKRNIVNYSIKLYDSIKLYGQCEVAIREANKLCR